MYENKNETKIKIRIIIKMKIQINHRNYKNVDDMNYGSVIITIVLMM